MSSLVEIEKAAERLPADQKQELIFFLCRSLKIGGTRTLPPPRDIPAGQIADWIREDEEGFRRFKSGS